MGKYLLDQVKDERLSVFLGFWATLTNALFAYIGTELIGVRGQYNDLFILLTYRPSGYRRRG
jgi:hypothetical protein